MQIDSTHSPELKTEITTAAIRAAFETWWRHEGCRLKYRNFPRAHGKLTAEMAWLKGAETALKVTK